MRDVAELYRGGFFKNRHKLNWRINPVCTAIENTFPVFKGLKGKQNIKIIDVGCAIGDYVDEFNRRGYTAWGIEGSVSAKPFAKTKSIIYCDIRKDLPFNESKSFDICYSLEVAEHLDKEYAEKYVNNLCFLSDNILITAAGPDQGGHGHINCQSKEYWVDLFDYKNYICDISLENIFKSNLEKWKKKRGINSYYNNCLIFRRI